MEPRRETVALVGGGTFTKEISAPEVSNVVIVAYMEEEVTNTSVVYEYIPVEHIPEAEGKRFIKNIPCYGRYNKILSARYGSLGRGLRVEKKQMEQICSMDVSLDNENLKRRKSVHCKLAKDTCHVTGAKSFEQGMQATKIIIKLVHETQQLIDNYRLTPESERTNDVFYELYKGERTREEVDELCRDMLEKSKMLCIRPIKIRNAVTSNSVFEIRANFKVFMKTLCEIAYFEFGFKIDYANWNKSSISSISIPDRDNDRPFYHRVQVNFKGVMRLSSPCDVIKAMDGYDALCKLLFRVWDKTQEIFMNRFAKIMERESLHRARIEEEFNEFWSDFADSSILEVSNEDIRDDATFEKIKKIYFKTFGTIQA